MKSKEGIGLLPEIPQKIINNCLGRISSRREEVLTEGFDRMFESNPTMADYLVFVQKGESEFLWGAMFMHELFRLEAVEKGEQLPHVSADTIRSLVADRKALFRVAGPATDKMTESVRKNSLKEFLNLLSESQKEKIMEEMDEAQKEVGYTPFSLKWPQLGENIALHQTLDLIDSDGSSQFVAGATVVLEYLWRQAQADKLAKDLGL